MTVESGRCAISKVVVDVNAYYIGRVDIDEGRGPAAIDANDATSVEAVEVEVWDPSDVPVLIYLGGLCCEGCQEKSGERDSRGSDGAHLAVLEREGRAARRR